MADGVPVEGVEEFIYLGSKQSSSGYCRPDVLRRIGLVCSVINSLQLQGYRNAILSVSTANIIIHQAVPSSGYVCPALCCRNMDRLGRRHERTEGYPHEVSATGTRYTLVGSCLQFRGASAIWFVNWWHLTSSTFISVWPCCTPGPWSISIWCSASDGGYKGRKPMASGRRPRGRPRNVWLNKVQEDAKLPTLYCYLYSVSK